MTAEQTREKLLTEPLYLAKVIVYNNPQAVAKNMEIAGYNGNDTNPTSVLNALLEVLPNLTDDQLIEVLNVDFDPLAANETSGYLPVLELQREAMNIPVDVMPTWAGTFAETLTRLRSAYSDFTAQQPTGTPANPTPKPCCAACAHKQDAKRLLLIVGGGLLALVLLVTLSTKTA